MERDAKLRLFGLFGLFVASLLAITACSGQGDVVDGSTTRPPNHDTSPEPTDSSTSAAQSGVGLLEDGPVTPGRHRYVVLSTCDPKLGCPAKSEPRLPDVLVTVPSGWTASNEFHLIEPSTSAGTGPPDGAALIMGWTNFWAALNSQPCSSVSHQIPDIKVGATVIDFVDAVVTHPELHVTEPRPIQLGKHRGQFFTLVGPSDISQCKEEWRPWEPSPYLQGPGNRWDIWVMDVDGVRVLIMAEYYPGTSAKLWAQLHDMAESIRFMPSNK
jgi:hypothetical protein